MSLSDVDRRRLYKSCPVVSAIGDIRVLQILPGLLNDRICCRLLKTNIGNREPAAIKNRRQYEALSYTWGTGETTDIVLNDKPGFPVTTNLSGALRRLRHQHKPRVLWVDALCVNQADLEERSGQVKLMGDIFSNALAVLVWLGDVNDNSWMLPVDQDCIVYETTAGVSRAYRSPEVRPVGSMDISESETQRCALHRALHDTEPSWWDRTWIVQEFCKAPSLQMCYGSFEESYDDFFSAEGLLWQLVSYNNQDVVCQSFWSAQYRLNDIRLRLRQGPLTIYDFVENCFRAAATDARDKAYSLRSMISVDEAKWIEPDYHATEAAVFARATYASIVGRGHIGILRYTWPTTGRDPELPSWSVDFRDNSLLPPEPIREQLRGLSLFESIEPWLCGTSFPVAQDPSYDEATHLLTLGGHFVASSQAVHIFERCSLIGDSPVAVTASQARSVTSMLTNLLALRNPRSSRLLTDCSKHRSRTVLDYVIDIFQGWYDLHSSANDRRIESRGTLYDYALFSATQEMADFSLFVTDSGHLGFVRGQARVGDAVTLLHGAPLPGLLRLSTDGSGTFTFQGLALVAFLQGEEGHPGLAPVSAEDGTYFAIG